jgi:hypothetical protein
MTWLLVILVIVGAVSVLLAILNDCTSVRRRARDL